MFAPKCLIGSTAIALVLDTSPVSADVNAQEVWADWKAYMNSFGYDMKSSEATSGDTLTVSDLTLTVPLPEGEGAFSMDIGEMSFTNRSDGTVEIGLEDKMPIDFKVTTEKGEDLEGTVVYANTGLNIIVSGDPADMTYQYTAASLDMTLEDLKLDGTAIDFVKLAFNMSGVTGSSQMKIGNIRDLAQDFRAEALSYNVDITPPPGTPDAPESFKMNGMLNDLVFNGTGAYPTAGFDPENIASMLTEGFAFDGRFGYTGGATNLSVVEDGKPPLNAASSSESGALSVAMSQAGLSYTGEANGLKSQMAGGDVPLPIEINAETSAFGLKMPIAKSDEAQDFSFKVLLGNFTTSEMLWSLIDSGGQLPRDPATLHLDLSGKAKLLFDMMDPESMASVDSGEQMPGELDSLKINTLELSAAGASLTGDGAFTFDNTDMTTFEGMPRPDGTIDLKLVGGNGLLDKLVAMGLLPEEQAMGARMMMGLFAVPGEEEDTLNSKIEFTEQGHILANGQRLK